MNITKNQLYIGLNGTHDAIDVLGSVMPLNNGFRKAVSVSLVRGR